MFNPDDEYRVQLKVKIPDGREFSINMRTPSDMADRSFLPMFRDLCNAMLTKLEEEGHAHLTDPYNERERRAQRQREEYRRMIEQYGNAPF